MNKKNNYFITIEGVEGAGKSTAIKYIHEYLTQFNNPIPHIITREPGGTEIAESIRQVLLSHYQEPMHSDTELLLMFASRAQHLNQVIKPNLEKGYWVICDRFTDASYAYQGGGRGVAEERICQLENWVQGNLRPDLVLIFDMPVEMGLQRIKQRQQEDRIEREKVEFFERVRQIYLTRAQQNPANYTIIDATQSIAHVQQQLKSCLLELI